MEVTYHVTYGGNISCNDSSRRKMSYTALLNIPATWHSKESKTIFKLLLLRTTTCTGFEEQKDHQLLSMVSSVVKCSETIGISVKVLRKYSR